MECRRRVLTSDNVGEFLSHLSISLRCKKGSRHVVAPGGILYRERESRCANSFQRTTAEKGKRTRIQNGCGGKCAMRLLFDGSSCRSRQRERPGPPQNDQNSPGHSYKDLSLFLGAIGRRPGRQRDPAVAILFPYGNGRRWKIWIGKASDRDHDVPGETFILPEDG
jgi:hypothetical protein